MSDLGGFSLFELFKAEAESHGATLDEGLLRLEEDPADVSVIEPLMRAAHSLKGAARIIGVDLAVRLAHAMEDCLVAVQKGQETLVPARIDQLLAGTFPWAKLRQAQKLLRIGHRYGFDRLDAACRRALAFDLVNVKRVEAIVLDALEPVDPAPQGVLLELPARFLRASHHFTHAKEIATHGHEPVTQDPSQTTQAVGDPCDTAGSRDLCTQDEAP